MEERDKKKKKKESAQVRRTRTKNAPNRPEGSYKKRGGR